MRVRLDLTDCSLLLLVVVVCRLNTNQKSKTQSLKNKYWVKKAAEEGHHRSASVQKLAWISASDAVALWNVKKKPKISS